MGFGTDIGAGSMNKSAASLLSRTGDDGNHDSHDQLLDPL